MVLVPFTAPKTADFRMPRCRLCTVEQRNKICAMYRQECANLCFSKGLDVQVMESKRLIKLLPELFETRSY
ncbi:hypothetical protein VPH35_075956 [Triticum aestivum]